MKFSELPEEERAEVVAAVRDSYRTPTGTTRSHRAALTAFMQTLDDAEQAHRPWVADLRRQWLIEGMRKFLQSQWKMLGVPFEIVDGSGKSHSRTTTRGAQRPDETGKYVWTQLELLDWGAEDLKLALTIEAGHVEEARVNIGMFRRLLDLLEQTAAPTVADALGIVGKTLDEFLNSDTKSA